MATYKKDSRLSACLAITIALSSLLTPAFAQSGTSVYQKLTEYEETLFGKADTGSSIDKRLQKVEKQLFGKVAGKNTSTAQRVAEIDGVMSGKTASKYFPPEAPTLDRSEFAPEPKQAPDSADVASRAVSRDIDAPLPAGNEDRIKGILRQAMSDYSAGKTADAEKAFLKVLAIDFRNVDANYNLGAIAESKGDLNAAQRYYSAALKGDPSDLELRDALSAVQSKLKSQQTAKAPAAHDSSASSMPPSAPPAGAPITAADRTIAAEAAAAYKKGNFDDAIEKLSYLSKKNPYDANTQFALGQAFRGKGKEAEAIKHLRAAASLDPKNDLYVKSMSDLQSQMDEKQTASAPGAGGAGGGSNDVTPFVGLPADGSSKTASASDIGAVEDYLRRNAGSVMIGSVSSGYGLPRGFSFGGTGYPGLNGGVPMFLGTAPGSTRLKRAVTSSLAGAAMGAMSNRSMPGGMSKGAMRGAMYGGLYGLMMGGY